MADESKRLDENAESDERRRRLAEWLQRPQDASSIEDIVHEFMAIRALYLQEMASRLNPALNAYIVSQPQRTYDEMSSLARTVNHWLQHLDLAVKCPQTGGDGYLSAHNARPSQPRIGIRSRDQHGHQLRGGSRRTLAEIQLVPASTMRTRARLTWAERLPDRHGADDDPPKPHSGGPGGPF